MLENVTRGRPSGVVRIGISGWTYGGWRGSFYPPGLRQADELSYASRQVDTIEINGTHYSLQRPEFVRALARRDARTDFVFAVKGSRFITHLKQLHDIETPLANFFASGVLRLEEKLGPFLWQFSPRFRFDAETPRPVSVVCCRATARPRPLWPSGTTTALAGRAWTRTEPPAASAACDRDPPSELSRPRLCRAAAPPSQCRARLRRLGRLALCRGRHRRFSSICACTAPKSSTPAAMTTRRSTAGRRGSSCGRAGLQPNDARLIAAEPPPRRRAARDVYVYFDNDAKVRAPVDARALRAKLG